MSKQPDSASIQCDYPSCTTTFSLYNRRHHCRRCGNLFCQPHSTRVVPLDQEARFHPKGPRSRSCDMCYSDYRAWHDARKSRSNSDAGSNPAGAAAASAVMSNPIAAGPQQQQQQQQQQHRGLLAGGQGDQK
ncbi:hypothetical protein LTS18_002305, partial [Coniosporium uncinatum]